MTKKEATLKTGYYGDIEIWSQDEMPYFYQDKTPIQETPPDAGVSRVSTIPEDDNAEDGSLEIASMLTISTAHISEETAALMSKAAEAWYPGMPSLYEKGRYGFLVFVSPDEFDPGNAGGCPEDLFACMKLAYQKGCEWLCLDRDGAVLGDQYGLFRRKDTREEKGGI